jgi:cell volume regulation protein A
MPTAILIIIIGLFIFWGHYLSNIFERKGIPDVLGLMLIGILIGPVFQWVDPAGFGDFGPLFTNLVLIFILFESGTDLRIGEVKASAKESAGITVLGFFTTWIVITLSCMYLFNLSLLASLFVGAALGGTSSAVVVGLVRRAKVRSRTSTTLIMESVETDVFTLAIPITILSLMLTGEFNINQALSHLISSLVIALMIGIGGGFLWSYILNKFPTLKNTKFITPAFLFILYGITEYLNFSGPLTALSFGIAIGNLQYLEPRFLERIVPNQEILLSTAERNFFSEMVFLLRTFFFVFIGLSIKIDRVDWLMLGALVAVLAGMMRLLIVPLVIPKSTPVLDKAIISSMIPKGLGSAVVATLPFQQGVAEGAIIQSICFSVILFSTLYTVLTFFLINSGVSMPVYRLLYRKASRTNGESDHVTGDEVISKSRADDLSRMK